MRFWEKIVEGLFLDKEVFRFKEGGGGYFEIRGRSTDILEGQEMGWRGTKKR